MKDGNFEVWSVDDKGMEHMEQAEKTFADAINAALNFKTRTRIYFHELRATLEYSRAKTADGKEDDYNG